MATPIQRTAIDGKPYAITSWETVQLGRSVRHDWDEGFAGGMGQFRWRGGPRNRYYISNGIDATGEGLRLLGRLHWTNSAVTGITTNKPIYTFIAEFSGTRTLYVLNDRYVFKIAPGGGSLGNTKDFGAGAICGKPELFNGTWYVPLGATVDAQKLTTIAGFSSADTWDTIGVKATSFAQTIDERVAKMARSLAHEVYFSPTPQTAGSWSAAFPVGASNQDITEIHKYRGEFFAVKASRLYAFDIDGAAQEVQEMVGDTTTPNDPADGLGLAYGQTFFWASQYGFARLQSGRIRFIGPENDPEWVGWTTLTPLQRLEVGKAYTSAAAFGSAVWTTLGENILFGWIQDDGTVLWHGSFLPQSASGDRRLSITSDGQNVHLIVIGPANTIYRYRVEDDGTPRHIERTQGGDASTKYTLGMPDVALAREEEQVQLRYIWYKVKDWDANCDLSFEAQLSGNVIEGGGSQQVGAAVAPTGEESGRVAFTPGTSDLCTSIRLLVEMETNASYSGTGNDPILVAFGIVGATPSLVRVEIPVTRGGLIAGQTPNSVIQDLRNLIDAGPVNIQEPALNVGDSDGTFVGWIKSVQERLLSPDELKRFDIDEEGWMVEVLFQRFDYGK